MMEAAMKAYKQLSLLRAALVAHAAKHVGAKNAEPKANAA
jgi:hypothetical protein